MRFLQNPAFKGRFRSPTTLALFGAFAAPEPLGTIMVLCAALWWWRSRKLTNCSGPDMTYGIDSIKNGKLLGLAALISERNNDSEADLVSTPAAVINR